MSEQHPQNHEKGHEQHKPTEHSNEHVKNHQERELSQAEKQHGKEHHVEHAAQKVEQHAVSGKEFSQSEKGQPKQHPLLVNKQLKDMAFTRALTRARKKLSVPNRAFSKVVHNGAVDKTSESLGKTIARPSGMLWGAIFAFVGTSALLWITRHYGYEYNYLVAILLFVIGMTTGLAAEGLWRLIRKNT